jgi:hypothetical protein
MVGFLPEFSTACVVCGFYIIDVLISHHFTKDAAWNAKMLNVLGCPTPSHFGTFNYSASTHLDADEGPSHGYVVKRPNSVSKLNQFELQQMTSVLG